jgi:hypothetical protein
MLTHISYPTVPLLALLVARRLPPGTMQGPCCGAHLAAEAARAADAMDVELAVVGQVVVDHQRHLQRPTSATWLGGWLDGTSAVTHNRA